MNYDHLAFFEFFDECSLDDKESGHTIYNVCSEGIKLKLSVRHYDDWVYFILSSKSEWEFLDFDLDNIEEIVLDKSQNRVRFLFYQRNKKLPIVILDIKPSISLSLDIPQKGNVHDFPYRKIV